MSSLMDPGITRERILADHDRLRALMKGVATSAYEALRDEKLRPSLCEALAELRGELERHLDFEELELVPLLSRADAWGPDRARDLVKDHAGQRALLVALTEDAGGGVRTMEGLVEEIDWFVESFERDMFDEEATFLNAEALGEDTFVADQLGG